MKAIYHHLNMFYVDVHHKCFVGEYWVPTKFVENVTDTIHMAAVSNDHDSYDEQLSISLKVQRATSFGPLLLYHFLFFLLFLEIQ